MLVQNRKLRRAVVAALASLCWATLIPTLACGADPPASSADAIDLIYVPEDALAVACLNVQSFVKQPNFAALLPLIGQQMQDAIGLDPTQIEDVRAIVVGVPGPGRPDPRPTIIVRTTASQDFTKLIAAAVPKGEPAAHQGKQYTKATRPEGMGAYQFNDRTLVLATEVELQKWIATGGKVAMPTWSNDWKKAGGSQMATMVHVAQLREVTRQGLKEPNGPPPEVRQVIDVALPLVENADRIFFAAAKEGVRWTAMCPSGADAGKVQAAIEQLLALGKTALAAQKDKLKSLPPQEALAVGMMMPMAENFLSSIQITRSESTVVASAKIDGTASTGVMMALLLPAVQASREAARRNHSLNNLKQLAIAMHNYYDAHKRLPGAANLGPDGKTVHSWRVALLPYLEENALYEQYKLNEPWDSENNKKLIDKMPEFFRCPSSNSDTDASYFVLTGKGTMFSDAKGLSFKNVTDGLSNTIMIVEAKREIPWTKPEDVAVEADKPLPTLGGFFAQGFCAALGDGSAQFIATSIDERILRALISASGGEAVGLPQDATPPRRAAPAARAVQENPPRAPQKAK